MTFESYNEKAKLSAFFSCINGFDYDSSTSFTTTACLDAPFRMLFSLSRYSNKPEIYTHDIPQSETA